VLMFQVHNSIPLGTRCNWIVVAGSGSTFQDKELEQQNLQGNNGQQGKQYLCSRKELLLMLQSCNSTQPHTNEKCYSVRNQDSRIRPSMVDSWLHFAVLL